MRFTPKELVLGLLFTGGAVGVATMGGREAVAPYAYLFDASKADTEQQRFLNAVIAHKGVTREELQPLMPKLRAIYRDLPVMIYVSRESGRPLTEIAEMRRSGMKWVEVYRKLGLPLKSLFAGMKGAPPEPYRRAWAEWRAKYRPELTDDWIRELALLQLTHQITGEDVKDVMKRGQRGATPQSLIARHGPPAPTAAQAPAGKPPAESRSSR